MDYSQDRSAAKLKGHNCIVKFKDGEELYLTIEELDGDADLQSEWLVEAERFINNDRDIEWFQCPGIALSRDSVKYIKTL